MCDKLRQMVFQQEVITNPRTELHTLQPPLHALAQGAAAQSDVSKDLPFANILKHPEGALWDPV